MKKIILIIFIILIALTVFANVDYKRAKNNKRPLFSIKISEYRDGGTKIYIGIGYTIIDFNTAYGYDEAKIGPWFFIKYNNFEEEQKEQEKKFYEEYDKYLEELLEQYS